MKNLECYDRAVAIGVDFENDFAPWGSLPVANADKAIDPFNVVADLVRRTSLGLVTFTRDYHPVKTNHFNNYGGPWPVHCVAGTYGAEFVEGLDIRSDDPVFDKGTEEDEDAYSGFQARAHDGSSLETMLWPCVGEHVAALIGGWATDYCIKATVLDGLELSRRVTDSNYNRKLGIYVIRDAIAAVNLNRGDGDQAIAEMEAAGAKFVTSEDLVEGRALEIRS